MKHWRLLEHLLLVMRPKESETYPYMASTPSQAGHLHYYAEPLEQQDGCALLLDTRRY